MELETSWSWKVSHRIRKIEVGKVGPKSESTTEVGNILINFERFNEVGKVNGS